MIYNYFWQIVAAKTNNVSHQCQAVILIDSGLPDCCRIRFHMILLAVGHSMPSNVRIYFNPACSKCRQGKALLEDRGENIEIVEYLATPPDRGELVHILDLLGLEPRALMRSHEAAYAELQLDRPEHSRDDLIAAMIAHPILIERPIVIKNGKAIIARPPERILEIL